MENKFEMCRLFLSVILQLELRDEPKEDAMKLQVSRMEIHQQTGPWKRPPMPLELKDEMLLAADH